MSAHEPGYLPLWSTGFIVNAPTGPAPEVLSMSLCASPQRGLVRDLSGTVTENQRQAEQQFPTKFLQPLVAGQARDAVTFCAFLLPRREAAWWACRSARRLGPFPQRQCRALLAAEAWVKEPTTSAGQAALELGTRGHCDDPLTWVALAAGWAGGFLGSGPHLSIPMPQYMTRGHARRDPDQCVEREAGSTPAYLQACIADGTRLAENGP